jgi:predicted DNA-binding transcriptional regulator AlpA
MAGRPALAGHRADRGTVSRRRRQSKLDSRTTTSRQAPQTTAESRNSPQNFFRVVRHGGIAFMTNHATASNLTVTSDRIVRPRELADRIGLSLATIWRLRRRGDLPEPIPTVSRLRRVAPVRHRRMARRPRAGPEVILRAHLAETRCRTPEELKAWSQNLGHERVLTTLYRYGAVATSRQGEIVASLAGERRPDVPLAAEIAKAVARELRNARV